MKFPQHRFKTTRVAFVVALFIGAGVVVPEGLPLSPAVAQTLDVRRAEARRLFDLGLQQAGAGQFEAAIQSWQKSLVIGREFGDRLSQAKTLVNLGSATAYLGRYSEAEQYYEQGLKLAVAIPDRPTQVLALAGLGNTCFSRGQYQRAIELQEQTLKLAEAVNDPENQVNALSGLGSVYDSLGLSQQAIPYYERALTIARKNRDRQGVVISLGNLAIAYSSLGRSAKAMEFYQQALQTARAIKASQEMVIALNGLGSVSLAQRKYADAIQYYQQALQMTRQVNAPQSAAIALGNLAIAYGQQKQYPQAIQSARQAAELAQQMGDRQSQTDFLNNLGLALFLSGQPQAAETALFQAIQVRETLRSGLSDLHKVSLIDVQGNAYKTLQKVLVAQTKPEAALEISERARARAFVELLLRRQISGVVSDRIPSLTIPQIKQIAKEHRATLVEYSIIQDEYEQTLYIWVVKPTGEIIFRQVDLKSQPVPLNELVTLSRQSIGVVGRGLGVQPIGADPTINRLQELYRLLIQPIADHLPTDPKAFVIFIPQSSLFLVPFPALQDASGIALIEKHTILTAPSIQVLQLTRQIRQKQRGIGAGEHRGRGTEEPTDLENQNTVSSPSVSPSPLHPLTPSPPFPSALIVGNPTMPKVRTQAGGALEPLQDLPGAQKEAAEIASLFKTQYLTGNQATKSVVLKQMPQARLIHLATHGLLDDFKGLGIPGAIALAPAGQDNGLLTADELLNLKLSAELVVLSACDTGRGRITGDGVIGLSRSLISAGVPSVIVSLWAIPDAPTAFLMKQFYVHLQQNPDKAQALRQAMLETKQRHPHPSYWAAFTLIGEAD